jgi:hypothetical protein
VHHVLLELAAASAVILLLQAAPWLPPAVRHVLYGEVRAGQGSKQVHAWQCHACTLGQHACSVVTFASIRLFFWDDSLI